MKTKSIVSATLIAAFLCAVGGGVVYARQSADIENDAAKALSLAKISLMEAARRAEAHVGGIATKAELESQHGVATFEVEVVTAQNQAFDVRVDGRDGTVLSSQADEADDADREDEAEGDHESKRK